LIGGRGYYEYMLQLRAEGSRTHDPLEAMLVEQFAWAHHQAGELHARAARAKSADEAGVLIAAAVRLTAECRKLALALRQYRTSTAVNQVTVVQQNVTSGNQQVALVTGVPATLTEEKSDDTRLPTSAGLAGPQPAALPAPDRRPAQPPEAPWAHSRGPREAPAGRPSQQALEEVHRAKNGRGKGQGGPKRQTSPEGSPLGP
jgi:hypothetical protein